MTPRGLDREEISCILRKVCDDKETISNFIVNAEVILGEKFPALDTASYEPTEAQDFATLANIRDALKGLMRASNELGEIGSTAVQSVILARKNFWCTAPVQERMLLAAVDLKMVEPMKAMTELIEKAMRQLDPHGRGAGRSPVVRAKRNYLDAVAFPILDLAEKTFQRPAVTTRDGWTAKLMTAIFSRFKDCPVNTQRLVQRYLHSKKLLEKFAEFTPSEEMKVFLDELVANQKAYRKGPSI